MSSRGQVPPRPKNSIAAGGGWSEWTSKRLSETYQGSAAPRKAMSSYVYSPLPPEDETGSETKDHGQDKAKGGKGNVTSTHGPQRLFTRMLVLHPGEHDDDIEVDLEIVALGGETLRFPRYDALSYVWGSEEKPGTVYVGKEKRTIPITSNLDEAIRHLRYPDGPRYMWIDALCIDQGNPEEQSRQVGYMSHIYWTAPRIVVWLGPGADDSDHAMRALQYIGSRICVDWELLRITGVTSLDDEQFGTNSIHGHLPLSERQYIAIIALMQRPWFERIWIRQEVFKANDKSRVFCGRKAVKWGEFQRGLYCCACHTLPRTIDRWSRQRWFARSILIQFVVRPFPYHLASLRHNTVGTLCTDPRDRIYAMLGLLHDDHKGLRIIPDYSKTVEELYQDVALEYLRVLGLLELLENCGRDNEDDNHSTLPTWVPDWSSPMLMPRPLLLVVYFCPFTAHAHHLGGGILRAAGVSLGTIEDFIDLDEVSTYETLAASIRSLVPRDAVDTDYPGGGNLWDAYRITLCAAFFCDRTEPPNFDVPKTSDLSLSVRDSEEAMRSIMAAEDLNKNNFLDVVHKWHHDGQFFTTREGYLGWAPKTVNRGDRIIHFLGCELPIMVRRSSKPDSECFEVIGPCYLHGFMYGEAFLGKLPDWLRPVVHPADSTSLPRFHDSRTGDIITEDPRLSTLPVDLGGFRRRREEGFDSRLDIGPETWRSRGVEVVDFDLV